MFINFPVSFDLLAFHVVSNVIFAFCVLLFLCLSLNASLSVNTCLLSLRY
jgi:hypothetical protein